MEQDQFYRLSMYNLGMWKKFWWRKNFSTETQIIYIICMTTVKKRKKKNVRFYKN